jgi:glycosyltransferase involved in cell wall biosynthesis
MTLPPVAIEMSPMTEGQYTGIPEVTARLCEAALDEMEKGRSVQFFLEHKCVPPFMVRELLEQRSGEVLHWVNQHILLDALSPVADGQPVIGLFPNQKTLRHFFHQEVQIVHDLSALLTPEFHHQDTIDFHGPPFVLDTATNALSICVSQATADDLLTYFGKDLAGDVAVCRLGANSEDFEEARAKMQLAPPGPFMLVLGTIEPRKNIEFLLAEFERNPQLLEHYTFIFVGRMGWGSAFSDLLDKYGLQEYHDRNRIITPGFVDQATKSLLMAMADCVIYPSLFEGFGLPVIEALAARTPVITTPSSSLREAGGDKAYYIPLGGENANLDEILEDILHRPRADFPVENVRSWRDFARDVFAEIDKLAAKGQA